MAGVTHTTAALCERARSGDREASDQLYERIYGELRGLAHRYMRRERRGHSMRTTGLVHEVYLKVFAGEAQVSWQSRAHVYRTAAQAMRRILVSRARRRLAAKRGGEGQRRVPLEAAEAAALGEGDAHEEMIVALDEGVAKLRAFNPRLAQVITLRFFGGLSVADAARVLGCSKSTVERDWREARSWLRERLAS